MILNESRGLIRMDEEKIDDLWKDRGKSEKKEFEMLKDGFG